MFKAMLKGFGYVFGGLLGLIIGGCIAGGIIYAAILHFNYGRFPF